MSNYIEYDDKVAIHPGYYIKELIEESGLTQEDYAKRLGTTPKNLSVLVRGEQSLSIDIATKLSRMLGTPVTYWLKIQQAYDEKTAEFISKEELKHEREVFELIDYSYFTKNYKFPLLKNKDEQIKIVREFLRVSSLTVLKTINLAVSFRSNNEKLTMTNIVNSNILVQIAINETLKSDTIRFNKKKFEKTIDYILSKHNASDISFKDVKEVLTTSGVVLVVLPNISNSGISGATKKVDGKVMIMVSATDCYGDEFWFTLFHEIGHVLNGDFGFTFNDDAEDDAERYAKRMLSYT